MKHREFLLLIFFLSISFASFAQKDTSKNYTDSFLLSRKGWLGQLARGIMRDTATGAPVRNDLRFQKYKGRVIRNIIVGQMTFGEPLTDSSKKIIRTLTHIANNLHRNTRETQIIKNLFFGKNDKVDPYLMGDNERYLRDLSFMQDARISVLPIKGVPDSVDVLVVTKDVFSLLPDVGALSPGYADFALTEDNILGTGNRISFKNLIDNDRRQNYAFGAEYVQRNIEGTFIDGILGYNGYALAINGRREENNYYVRLIKPLVNPYVRWTYSFEASSNHTRNMYSSDSIYNSQERYKYAIVDGWAGVNFNAQLFSKSKEENRFRGVISLRYLNKKFEYKPNAFDTVYNWRYASISGVLGALTLFRQDFYKANYFYGFGRNEDVPEGINLSVTGGATVKEGRHRPYMGLDLERYYFTSRDRYFNYTFRFGGYFYQHEFEDINLLGNVTYFDRLKKMGRWKQRFSLEGGVAQQINSLLNEPLVIQSDYGLPEINNGNIEGTFRATVKAETVFYSPWSLVSFRFAPFLFGNFSYLNPTEASIDKRNVYTSIGGGIRTRNESLIFGTIELKAYYFPDKTIYNHSLRIEFNTNIRFKYNTQFIKKPDFINVN
jgi:hypothetical protein